MIGIFIGSFNPPTLAHLNICLKLKEKYQKIVFVPVTSQDKELIDIKYRLEMLNILKRKYPFLEIDNIMIDYSYLNYRIIDILKKKYQNIEIIMGSDLLEKFDKFDSYEYLLKNYRFMVVTRFSLNTKKMIRDNYFKYQDKFNILEFYSEISSSMVRNLLKKETDIKDFLDEDVYDYIKKNNLYV